MISLNKMFFYGLTFASLNLLSCNRESTTEIVQEDYLKPLLGTWRQLEQNNRNIEYIIKVTFSNEQGYGPSYFLSYNDTANNDSRAYKAKIEEITASTYRTKVTHQYGKWSWNFIDDVTDYKYFIQGNNLYEDDSGVYSNVYRRE